MKEGEYTKQTEKLVVITLAFLDFILRTVADLEGVKQDSDRIKRAGKTNACNSNNSKVKARQLII